MKINLGSGGHLIPGHVNIDAHDDRADVVADLRSLDYEGVEEVVMSHVLEHLPWRDTVPALRRVHSWMVPDGLLWCEVPDWEVISRMDPADERFCQWVFGEQSHPGEYHHTAFTRRTLRDALEAAGWRVERIERFDSEHPARHGYPCIEAVARA